MGNCLPCLREKEVDRRSARTSYFDAKLREKQVMAYTSSEFNKEKKLGVNVKYKITLTSPKKQLQSTKLDRRSDGCAIDDTKGATA
ncbi:unnamed protein product [Ectocarpus sp. 4 AP-2014]|uniref:EsV-1-225 n=1 Tax=Ectocarpus siliculosus virus 1 (isolate New Zealand/Kaikoura/1988) TaxID=654926 RepID=Q8QN65_ESV1K|nr:EsV-1-225 [Ectocarpus siliculosus virus 1]AAK14639.1 EsV-1-225 [Ectocarpus siliculosus virus 1]